ncbi:polysaccharide deacetylase family protein [Streptomyces calidiresistens]
MFRPTRPGGSSAVPSGPDPARRRLLGLGAVGALGLAAPPLLAGCGGSGIPHPGDPSGGTDAGGSTGDDGKGGGETVDPGPSTENPHLIGDGSTADTGPQPRQPEVRRLEAGERPPQFVVVSWDGAAALDDGLFGRFLGVAEEIGGAMTFFLSGLYLLPEARKERYLPPRNAPGASDIGYLSDGAIRETIRHLRTAWLDGHEIGTHFNGHFCAGSGSVANWTPEEWRDEIEQAIGFVTEWRTNTGFEELEPLPFDYRRELVGGRTPCLLGQDNLLPTAAELGWRYDASSPGRHQVWPERRGGIWDLPLQLVPFPGRSFEVLSMDYNIMVNQSGGTQGDPARHGAWRDEARGAFVAGFERAHAGNRAPLFIGNHFQQWNGGIYMDAVEEALVEMAERSGGEDDVRFVSFRQLCDWLDAQDPVVLENLRGLGPGQAPAGGWSSVVTA